MCSGNYHAERATSHSYACPSPLESQRDREAGREREREKEREREQDGPVAMVEDGREL